MVFMHSTLLTSNTESVDFFIYRKAEEKAIKIGKVSRVLKENSVDFHDFVGYFLAVSSETQNNSTKWPARSQVLARRK